MRLVRLLCGAAAIAVITATAGAAARADIPALVLYESKPADALKAYASPVRGGKRVEALGVMEVDPTSPRFGAILREIALPPDLIAHHIFYNRDETKLYMTSLGKRELRVIDMTDQALPMKTVAVPDCEVGEDVIFSEDNRRWYLTCMGSSNVVEGDAVSDTVIKSIALPKPYAHGIAIHNGIDRMLVTSTVRPSDMGDAGDSLSIIKPSTGEVMGTLKVSDKPGRGEEAPVEILFVPGANPPVAYVTNLNGGSLWTATWNPAKQDFDVAEAFDFAPHGAAAPLEMYFNDDSTRLYVTTAKPGHLHIFDIAGAVAKPRLLQSIATAEGSHHVAFNQDMSIGWVQNSLLNLPGMSDGSVTVVDLRRGQVIASMDSLKKDGFNPNCIVLLPEWNHLAGH